MSEKTGILYATWRKKFSQQAFLDCESRADTNQKPLIDILSQQEKHVKQLPEYTLFTR